MTCMMSLWSLEPGIVGAEFVNYSVINVCGQLKGQQSTDFVGHLTNAEERQSYYTD